MATAGIAAPNAIEQIGVGRKLLEELAVKVIYLAGEILVRDLAQQMCVSLVIAEELFNRLRREALCEVTGMAGSVHRIALTTQGRGRALELLALNQYTGPAPVSLTDYIQKVRTQSVIDLQVRPEMVEKALQHLVIEKTTIRQLGTAVVSGKSVFLYGSTGSGKSSIAESLGGLFSQDAIWLPHAVAVDGQIITVFDPLVHTRIGGDTPGSHDGRWVRCRRPRLMVGGELTIEMLDLQFNPVTKYYSAPVQMKANNGLLIIDDFGRQRLRPEELLNRWVVPLDRRIDFLTLSGGKKIEIPFDMFVVFATNLDPASLVDEAFLRRLNTKVKVDTVTPEQFHEISRRVCRHLDLGYDPAIVDELIDTIRTEVKLPLRACYPRDIMQQICWTARYDGRAPVLTREAILQACRNYFVAPTS